ncbi:MAG: response regulator [Bacteroidia bacterium]|nr:response regulator [Bacteroidia bacterium]
MIKILVVDDEQDVQMLIRQKFRKQISANEYTFLFAQDGLAALEIWGENEDIDVVVSDINMPRMDGLTLLTRLRERSQTTQVVMISAYGDMANIRTAMNRGAFDFIVKPIDFQDLQLTITKTIGYVQQLYATREQLRRIDMLKDQFLANTSHELRTPLLGIIGLAESMSHRIQNAEDQEDISMIISSGRRLSYLVDDILDFSRLRNSDIALQCRPVHIRSMADVVIKNFAALVQGKNIQLINTISEDISSANADENRLLQVFFNLVGNAVKFTEEGHIQISARETNDMLEIAVADTGIGIQEDQQETIFQEFTQGDATITRNYAGTGLGLPISRKLVELHGGHLWLESVPGKGSTFFFTLPVSHEKTYSTTPLSSLNYIQPAAPNFPEIKTTEIITEGIQPQRVHILIVDDEPVNQQVLKNHLISQRFRISQALNGEDALRIIESDDSINLVLLDVMMPRMSGYEVCEKIRRKHLAAELPIIMVTAKNQVQDLVQGLSSGANDYIAKPFSREEFLARIHTQLDLHRIFDVAGRFVPNEFIRALGHERITQVALGDQTEREVTVLFSDIRDYTTFSETMTPEQNFGFINAFHGRMGPIIQKYEGFVNQYLGDGIMALFPISAEDALKSAIQMHKALRHYNDSRLAKGRKAIRMGIGMHTGSLIMGIIGDEKRLEAATISDTVNTTARIETLTKYFGSQILLSESSFLRLQNPADYHLRYLGPVSVKGKQQPVKVFECFDADSPALLNKKTETLPLFNEGIQYFSEQDFNRAFTVFKTLLAENPDDAAARLYFHKTSHFITHGIQDLNMVVSSSEFPF